MKKHRLSNAAPDLPNPILGEQMKNVLALLVVALVCVAPAAMAADDGNTQPKNNTAVNNSSTTATDLIPLTNGAGNVKGIICALNQDGWGNLPDALVKFYVNGGSAQSVTLRPGYLHNVGDPGYVVAYTGWVPFNVRFTSSIRVTIQKAASSGSEMDCQVSWGLD
jgi:hypothetical protein